MHGWRLAAGPGRRGGGGKRKGGSPAPGLTRSSFVAPPRRRSPRQSPRATTPTRSSSHGGSWRGRSRSPPLARPSRCPRCLVPPSLVSLESSLTPEIVLSQTLAHVRHGSNMGQPRTRRDGVLKMTGAAKYAADQHPPGMLHAVLAVSNIARGHVAFLDVAAAKAHPVV